MRFLLGTGADADSRPISIQMDRDEPVIVIGAGTVVNGRLIQLFNQVVAPDVHSLGVGDLIGALRPWRPLLCLCQHHNHPPDSCTMLADEECLVDMSVMSRRLGKVPMCAGCYSSSMLLVAQIAQDNNLRSAAEGASEVDVRVVAIENI